MSRLPTSSERIDTTLTAARSRAASYAVDGNDKMAYQVLLRGIRSAQRVNGSGSTGAALQGLWALPAVKGAVLAGVAAVTAAVTRGRKTSTKPASTTSSLTSEDRSLSASEPSRRRSRLRDRSRRGTKVTVVDVSGPAVTPHP